MARSKEMQSEIGLEAMEGTSELDLQPGSETWFAEVVELPNWGINPLRDLSHVRNTDILEVFQRKVSHRGYQIRECKSAKVKSRMEEMWEPVFQCKPPGTGYMPESFARAIISEVLYSTNIDWAKFASAKWRAKTRPARIYTYTEGGNQLTYKKVILQNLQFDKDEINEEIAELQEKRDLLTKNVQDIRQLPEVVLKADRMTEIETELKRIRKKLQRTKVDLKHSKKMAKFIATDPECNEESEEWLQRVASNEEQIQSLISEIEELSEVNQRENPEVLNALAAVKDVKTRLAHALGRLGQIQSLYEVHSRSTRRPQTFSPSCIVGDLQDDDEDGNMKPCALCGRGFPNRDIFIASCGCHYHPWCIATQTWNSDLYSDSTCQQEFALSWRRSMGLHHIEDSAMELISDPTRSPEQGGKGHLNSDIGGLTPKIKLHRESDAGNTSKSAKKKKL